MPPPEAPPPSPVPAAGADGFAARRALYLARNLEQMRHFERRARLDEYRFGEGALAAAANAAASPAAGREAARWAEGVLAICGGRWQSVDCERAELALQRLVLQLPESLPEPFLGRLRREVTTAAEPPGEAAVARPWDFRETENQRIVKMARSLVAEVVRGTPESLAAQAWGAAALAFLDAHAQDGWYEAESPGYVGFSISALLHLADFAPQEAVRRAAARALDGLFADWAELQVNGFPAGPKSRSYVHWALGTKNTPWLAWGWLLAGLGEVETISVLDWPELALARYEVPVEVRRRLAERSAAPPYEVKRRRTIPLPTRRSLDTALYSYATPDYILGAAQSIQGLTLGVSGGQEIALTLFAAGAEFAPLYLWSRTQNLREERWKSWAQEDAAVADHNLAVARLGAGPAAGRSTGYAYLAAPWGEPEVLPAGTGELLVARCGSTYVLLATAGGWEIARAARRFPDYFGGDAHFRDAWVAVPKRQPAAVGLEVGRAAEVGDFAAWKERAARARLALAGPEIQFETSDGRRLAFVPGERAALDGREIDARAYPHAIAQPAGPGRVSPL